MTCSRFLSVVPYLQSSWTDSGLCVIKYNTDTADLLHTWNVKSVHTISSTLRCSTHFPVLQQICFCCCCFVFFFSISKVNWRIKPLYLLKPAKSLAVRTLKTSRLFFSPPCQGDHYHITSEYVWAPCRARGKGLRRKFCLHTGKASLHCLGSSQLLSSTGFCPETTEIIVLRTLGWAAA